MNYCVNDISYHNNIYRERERQRQRQRDRDRERQRQRDREGGGKLDLSTPKILAQLPTNESRLPLRQ